MAWVSLLTDCQFCAPGGSWIIELASLLPLFIASRFSGKNPDDCHVQQKQLKFGSLLLKKKMGSDQTTQLLRSRRPPARFVLTAASINHEELLVPRTLDLDLTGAFGDITLWLCQNSYSKRPVIEFSHQNMWFTIVMHDSLPEGMSI